MYRDKARYGQDPATVIRSSTATFNSPLRWKEPARVFVCSWSDFFIEDADEWRGFQCILQVEKVAFSGKMVDGIRLYPVESARRSRPLTRPAPVEAEPPLQRPAPVQGRVADPSAADEPVAPRKPVRGIPKGDDIPF